MSRYSTTKINEQSVLAATKQLSYVLLVVRLTMFIKYVMQSGSVQTHHCPNVMGNESEKTAISVAFPTLLAE